MTRPEILDNAKKCVCGDREQDYGSPENNFSTIAKLWEAYKGTPYTAVDVAAMLMLLKIGRISSGHGKSDNWIDAAGYAACGGEIESKSKPSELTQEIREELFVEKKLGKWDGISNDALRVVICTRTTCDKCSIETAKRNAASEKTCWEWISENPEIARPLMLDWLKKNGGEK